MYNTLKQAFLVNLTCKVNGFIYRLQHLPWIGKYFTDSLYGNEGILFLIQLLVVLFSALIFVGGKLLYLFSMIYFPMTLMPQPSTATLCTIFLFLTLAGGIVNTKMLQATTKKYYAIHLLRMDSKSYALSHLWFYLGNIGLSFVLGLLIIFLLTGTNLWYIIPMVFLLIEVKVLGESLDLSYYRKHKKSFSNIIWTNLFIGCGSLALGYGLGYFFPLPLWVSLVVPIVLLIPSFLAMKYLHEKPNYRRIYKETVTKETAFFQIQNAQLKQTQTQLKIAEQDLEISDDIKNKDGYEYFNSLFFARHKKLLLTSAKKTALIFLGIAVVALGVDLFIPSSRPFFGRITMNYLPYFVFIMYATNRGAIVTQAMFFNCDHSMLTYKFYREPKIILEVFKTRLKTIIQINLIPGIVVATSLPILMGCAQAGTLWNGISIFLAIIFTSIFFSVHHLVIYYLLQPYDIEMKEKSSMYQVVNSITYLLCYFCLQIRVATEIFSIGIILLTAIYIVLALILVYRKAPKTFRLKQ